MGGRVSSSPVLRVQLDRRTNKFNKRTELHFNTNAVHRLFPSYFEPIPSQLSSAQLSCGTSKLECYKHVWNQPALSKVTIAVRFKRTRRYPPRGSALLYNKMVLATPERIQSFGTIRLRFRPEVSARRAGQMGGQV